MTTVTMQFGDGTFKEIEVSATEPQEALEEAKTYVKDNAWFEVVDLDDGTETEFELPLVGPYER